MTRIDPQTMIEIEAAAFRALRQHLLQARPEVQNIDMMNLAGFCRNCLARWVQEAAVERGVDLSKDAAREVYYGMPYDAWRAQHQTDADAAKQAAFAVAFDQNVTRKD
jgi:hypothetical protein